MIATQQSYFTREWERCIAVYESDGTLVDAHYKRAKGKRVFVSFKHRRVRDWLEAQGRQEARFRTVVRR